MKLKHTDIESLRIENNMYRVLYYSGKKRQFPIAPVPKHIKQFMSYADPLTIDRIIYKGEQHKGFTVYHRPII